MANLEAIYRVIHQPSGTVVDDYDSEKSALACVERENEEYPDSHVVVKYVRADLQAPPAAAPDCGACPGDGSMCPKVCRHAEENPPAAAVPADASKPVGHVRGATMRGGYEVACIEWTGESLPYGTALFAAAPVQAPPAAAVSPGWRVIPYSGSFKFSNERWEVYDPSGSGGAVYAHDVSDERVRRLLDALAERATQAPPAAAVPLGRYSVGLVDDGTGHCILLDGMACGGQWSRSDAETIVRALNATLLPCAKRDV